MRARLLAVVVAGLALATCGGDPSAEDERRRLADELIAEVGDDLGREEADCVAGRLQEELGDDSFQQVLDAADRRRSEDAAAVRATVIGIFGACGALGAVATTDG